MTEIDPLLAEELWRRGELRWKLRDYQQEFYDQVWAFLNKDVSALTQFTGQPVVEAWRKLFDDCHRRYGKSFDLFAIGTEVGLGKPCRDWPSRKRVIRFAAPTMLDLEEIYHPIAEDLFEDCPDDIRPIWTTSHGRGHYFFPSTESRLYLFGVDAHHYKKGRGKKCHLGVVDEAGACEPGCEGGIKHVVNSILMPQTFSIDGCIVIATTPPETPGHSSGELKAQCQATGAYFQRTLYDTAHYFGEDVVEEYARECGGRETTAFRREYLCEWIVDETRAVIPEFTLRKGGIVQVSPPPTYESPLVAMDVGFGDWHAILFGYWWFEKAKLVVQDEAFLRRSTTDKIAAAVVDKEHALWARDRDTGRNKHLGPISRWSDTDLRLIADLGEAHRLTFSPTAKDDKEAQVNALRMLVASERLIIDPRCVNLVRHLLTAVWNKQRTEFDRTEADGHYDGVDALIYMLRNAPRYQNPYPALPPEVTVYTHQVSGRFQRKGSSEVEALKEVFRRRA